HATAPVPRCRPSQSRHNSRNARHTCSAVSSAFFPPQPLRVTRHEPQRRQAQAQVPQQRRVVAPLEVREPQLRLAHPQAVLHASPRFRPAGALSPAGAGAPPPRPPPRRAVLRRLGKKDSPPRGWLGRPPPPAGGPPPPSRPRRAAPPPLP